MAKRRKLSRRAVVIGGTVLGAAGCLPAAHLDDELLPVAHRQEDNVPDFFESLYDPLVLHGTVDLNGQGATQAPNVASLTNPHDLPMEILSVRFTAYPIPPSTTELVDFAFGQVTGAAVGVKMDLGKLPIVDADVPIFSFDDYRHSIPSYYGSTGPKGNLLELGTPQVATCEYWWKLKHPLYVPAGAALAPTFTHLGHTPYPIRVHVSYVCRTLKVGTKMPTRRWLPWVQSFNSKSFNIILDTAATTDVSQDTDLSNPHAEPVMIQRFTGRHSLYVLGAAGRFAGPSDTWGGEILSNYLNIRMRGSRGDEIIREYVPFEAVFPRGSRTWEMAEPWAMQPGEFYKVFLSMTAIDFAPTTYFTSRLTSYVGLVGYREIH